VDQLTFSFQGLVATLLQLAAVVAGVVGCIQVAMTRPDAFPAASKLSKGAWLAIIVVATLVAGAFGVLHLLGLLAAIAIIVYWVDVRPALQRVQGRGRQDGPYGPW